MTAIRDRLTGLHGAALAFIQESVEVHETETHDSLRRRRRTLSLHSKSSSSNPRLPGSNCSDPEAAIEILKTGGVDLVLTDLMMPKLNGQRLIDQMKAISPETPALLFSGSVNCCSEEHLADAWLPKGEFAPMELLERIRVLLIRKRGPKRLVTVPRQLAS